MHVKKMYKITKQMHVNKIHEIAKWTYNVALYKYIK